MQGAVRAAPIAPQQFIDNDGFVDPRMEAMQGKKTAVSATGGYGMKNAALVGTLVPEGKPQTLNFMTG